MAQSWLHVLAGTDLVYKPRCRHLALKGRQRLTNLYSVCCGTPDFFFRQRRHLHNPNDCR